MIEVLLFITLSVVVVYAILAIIYQIFRYCDNSLPITYKQFKAMYGIAPHKWDIPGYDLDGIICSEEIEYKPGKFESIFYFRPRTYFTYLRIFRMIRKDERHYSNRLQNLKMAKAVDYFKADLEEYKQKENASHQNYSPNNERPNVDEKGG